MSLQDKKEEIKKEVDQGKEKGWQPHDRHAKEKANKEKK